MLEFERRIFTKLEPYTVAGLHRCQGRMKKRLAQCEYGQTSFYTVGYCKRHEGQASDEGQIGKFLALLERLQEDCGVELWAEEYDLMVGVPGSVVDGRVNVNGC